MLGGCRKQFIVWKALFFISDEDQGDRKLRHLLKIMISLGCLVTLGGAKAPPPTIVEPDWTLLPADAATQGVEADVPVTLSVGPAGELRCSAAAGIASSQLRLASCKLIADRDVFGPRIVNGMAVATSYNLVVRWKKRADNQQFGGAVPIGRAGWISHADYPFIARHDMLTGRVSVAFDITDAGTIENCKIVRTNTTTTLADAVCPLLQQRAAFLPALGPDRRPLRAHGTFNADWRWCEATPCPSPDTGK